MLFQLLLSLFALFALTLTLRQYHRKKVSLQWTILWMLLWVAVILVALLPQATDPIAQRLGVERGADLFVYIGIVVLAYGLYRVFVRLERIQKELTDLARAVAIDRAEDPHKKA